MNQSPPPALQVHDISKTYGAVRALRHIDLELGRAETIGLIGENGAGKSTLVGILSGSIRPDTGTVVVHGESVATGDRTRLERAGVSVVVQEQALVETLTVAENLYLTDLRAFAWSGGVLKRKDLKKSAHAHLERMGITGVAPNRYVGDLSFPQRQLVEIAKAFVGAERADRPPIVLLDEPTSALSKADSEILFNLINTWRSHASFIYISHILSDVRSVADRIVVMKDGAIVETLQNKGLTDSDLHTLMVGTERKDDYYRTQIQSTQVSNTPVMQTRSLSAGLSFSDLTLSLYPGEVVGIAGVVGSGASELAAALAGARPVTAGELLLQNEAQVRWNPRRARRAGVLYVPPERALDAIFPHASVRNNISIGFLETLLRQHLMISLSRERRHVTELVATTKVKTQSLTTLASELSGGNQQKLIFARWLDLNPLVMILNEPTRGIDVGTREEIYQLIRGLAESGCCIILCSESLEELIGLSTRIIAMKKGQIVGNIDSPVDAKPSEVELLSYIV